MTAASVGTVATYVPETFSLERLIELGCDKALLEARVAMPARVLSVQSDGTVTILPGFKTQFVGEAPKTLPSLGNVPVAHIRGNDYGITLPVAAGDTGFCLMMDRALDTWLASDGNPQSPDDMRAHHLSDAIFVPMLTTAQKRPNPTQDMLLENGLLSIRLTKTGRISVRNGGNELLSIFDHLLTLQSSLLDALKALQIVSPFGPLPVLASSIAQLEAIETQVKSVQQQADTFLSASGNDA